jgi:hypothetical protein
MEGFMRTTFKIRLPVSAVAAVIVLLLVPMLMSQTTQRGRKTAPAAAPKVLKIRQARVVGRQTLVASPEFRTSISKSGGRPKKWSIIEVEYDTAPKWIDILTVKFSVMTMAEVDGKMALSIFQETIDFSDVEQGREHRAATFLRPKTVKRYGEPVVVHVEFLIDGKLVAVVDELDPLVRNMFPPDWYKSSTVLQKKSVTVRDGYLLNRSQTPFALINIDHNEVIR